MADSAWNLAQQVDQASTWERMTEEDRRGVVAAAFAWREELRDATRPTWRAGRALLKALATAQSRLMKDHMGPLDVEQVHDRLLMAIAERDYGMAEYCLLTLRGPEGREPPKVNTQ